MLMLLQCMRRDGLACICVVAAAAAATVAVAVTTNNT